MMCIQPLNKEDLEKLHTKQLLNKLNEQRFGSFDCEFCPYDSICFKTATKNKMMLKEILNFV